MFAERHPFQAVFLFARLIQLSKFCKTLQSSFLSSKIAKTLMSYHPALLFLHCGIKSKPILYDSILERVKVILAVSSKHNCFDGGIFTPSASLQEDDMLLSNESLFVISEVHWFKLDLKKAFQVFHPKTRTESFQCFPKCIQTYFYLCVCIL